MSRSVVSLQGPTPFCRVPTAKMLEKRRNLPPRGLIFSSKVPSVVKHEKMRLYFEHNLRAFLKVLDPLDDKLGLLLVQCPYNNRIKFRSLGFFLERIEPFLK